MKSVKLRLDVDVAIKPVYKLCAGDIVLKKYVDGYDVLRVENIIIFEHRGIISVRFRHDLVKIYDINKNVLVIDNFDAMIKNGLANGN